MPAISQAQPCRCRMDQPPWLALCGCVHPRTWLSVGFKQNHRARRRFSIPGIGPGSREVDAKLPSIGKSPPVAGLSIECLRPKVLNLTQPHIPYVIPRHSGRILEASLFRATHTQSCPLPLVPGIPKRIP